MRPIRERSSVLRYGLTGLLFGLSGCWFGGAVTSSDHSVTEPPLPGEAPLCGAAVAESHAFPNTGGFTANAGQMSGISASGSACALGSAGCYPVNLNPWIKRVVNLGAASGGTSGTIGHPNARCNDGSPAVYYVQRGVDGSGPKPWRKRWVVYLHAGGACFDTESCATRWGGSHDNLMSNVKGSTGPGAGSVDGLTANSALKTPAFWDANHVIVEYCSSDSWSGDVGASLPAPNYVNTDGRACGQGCSANQVCCVSGGWRPQPTASCVSGASASLAAKACVAAAPMDDARRLHFRGRAIVQAVLDELQSGVYDGTGDETPGTGDPDGFDRAAEFLLSGTSAGGYGVFSGIDDISRYLRTDAEGTKPWSLPGLRVLGLADAGFFISNSVSCAGGNCGPTGTLLAPYDPSLLVTEEIVRRSAITWGDDTGSGAGGRGDKSAYDFYLTDPRSPFATVNDPGERRLLARAESLKMDRSAMGFISTPLLIQQSEMDLNQLGWAGLQNDPQVPITAGEYDHGLLSDGSASGPYSSFNAHNLGNFATTGHNRGGDNPGGCYGRLDGNPPCTQICSPGAFDCLGSKQAYANYFAGRMRDKLLETDPIHWIFSRVDAWHSGFSATEAGSGFDTTLIPEVSTWATGGIAAGAFPNDTLYFHNGAVAKDMVRSWYFAEQCRNPLRVVAKKYRYPASKWPSPPPGFPSVESAPSVWSVLNLW